MQENLKQVKRAKTLNIIAICLLLVLFTASIFLAVIAPVFTCKVASAADTPAVEVTDLQSQASSDYTLQNIASYSKLYGVFINKDFTLSYDDCVSKDSYFGLFGINNPLLSITSTSSNNLYTCQFTFGPLKITNESLSDFGVAFTLTAPVYGLYVSFGYPDNSAEASFEFCTLIYNDIADYNSLLSWDMSSYLGFHNPIITLFDFSSRKKLSDTSVTYSDFVPSVVGMDSNMLTFWSRFIYLSLPSIGGSSSGVSQEDYDSLLAQYNSLQNQFDDFVSESTFSYLSTVSLENAYYFNQNVPERSGTSSYTFGPNASDNTLPKEERDFTCPVNGFYSNTIYRRYLFGVQLPFVVPAGSTIKLNYTCFCVGASFTGVPFSELWRLGYTYAFFFGQYGYPTIDEPGQMVVVDSFNNANGDIYVKVNQPTSYVAFDVVLRTDNSQRLSGYFSVSDSGVFSLHTDSSLGHQWFLAFNTLNVYYQGDMLASAVDSAKKEGYNKGYQEGKVAGREVGYQEGIKDQGDYTFMGLLGAVFDAPVQAFKGLLSFEVLGVNMTAFVSSLFGLAVILLIIKLILGGK